MTTLLTPKLDLVFKLLFAEHENLLLDLINSVLAYPNHLRIKHVEVKNPTVLPDDLTEKFIILDILAIDDRQQQYDIEMQVQRYAAYPERALFYLCRLYGTQLESGADYGKLLPVIGIHFLDFEHFPMIPEWHTCFELRETHYHDLCLTRDLSLHLFELPKLERAERAGIWGDSEWEWLHFLNHAHEENSANMRTQYRNSTIHHAFDVLESLSADKETRYRAEMRDRALKNEIFQLRAAREEGFEEGHQNGMQQGLQQGMQQGLAFALEVKFGDKGRALMPLISAITNLAVLQELQNIIKYAENSEMVQQFLETRGNSEKPRKE